MRLEEATDRDALDVWLAEGSLHALERDAEQQTVQAPIEFDAVAGQLDSKLELALDGIAIMLRRQSTASGPPSMIVVQQTNFYPDADRMESKSKENHAEASAGPQVPPLEATGGKRATAAAQVPHPKNRHKRVAAARAKASLQGAGRSAAPLAGLGRRRVRFDPWLSLVLSLGLAFRFVSNFRGASEGPLLLPGSMWVFGEHVSQSEDAAYGDVYDDGDYGEDSGYDDVEEEYERGCGRGSHGFGECAVCSE
jgi:hypothetical protein